MNFLGQFTKFTGNNTGNFTSNFTENCTKNFTLKRTRPKMKTVKFSLKFLVNFVNWSKKLLYLVAGKQPETFWFGKKLSTTIRSMIFILTPLNHIHLNVRHCHTFTIPHPRIWENVFFTNFLIQIKMACKHKFVCFFLRHYLVNEL